MKDIKFRVWDNFETKYLTIVGNVNEWKEIYHYDSEENN